MSLPDRLYLWACHLYVAAAAQVSEQWVEWIEPFGPDSEPVFMRVPHSTAVASARAAAHQAGRDDLTDEQLFDDFMIVHWAEHCDAPKIAA